MTQDEIIEMARQAGITVEAGGRSYEQLLRIITRFAKLVAQHEREACAKDLYEASEAAKDVDPQGFVWRAVKECADAIRARGQA
jgi:hypothetical protein